MRRLALPTLGGVQIALLLVPLCVMATQTSPAAFSRALSHPSVASALGLSLGTTSAALALMLVLGTPLAWLLARRPSRVTRPLEALLEIPVVLPPAVVGVALLATFGASGPLGGLSLAFTVPAVVLAQFVVASPLYIQGTTAAFRQVDEDLLLVAATLGASPAQTFRRVVLPIALPGVSSAAALAWARALGEFGATLFFAGNLPGRTQTLPLAIYSALERDPQEASAIALLLILVAVAVLAVGRGLASR